MIQAKQNIGDLSFRGHFLMQCFFTKCLRPQLLQTLHAWVGRRCGHGHRLVRLRFGSHLSRLPRPAGGLRSFRRRYGYSTTSGSARSGNDATRNCACGAVNDREFLRTVIGVGKLAKPRDGTSGASRVWRGQMAAGRRSSGRLAARLPGTISGHDAESRTRVGRHTPPHCSERQAVSRATSPPQSLARDADLAVDDDAVAEHAQEGFCARIATGRGHVHGAAHIPGVMTPARRLPRLTMLGAASNV